MVMPAPVAVPAVALEPIVLVADLLAATAQATGRAKGSPSRLHWAGLGCMVKRLAVGALVLRIPRLPGEAQREGARVHFCP